MTLMLQGNDLRVTMRAGAKVDGPSVDGTLALTEYDQNGFKYVHVRLELNGDPEVLKPGVHAVHFHEKADCGGPPFKCAGGHFDPGPAGNTDPDANHGYHAGDLPSIVIGDDGTGILEAVTTRVTLSPSPVSLLDPSSAPEGTSLMVHANPDPFTPGESGSGWSGGPRLACGVIEPAQ
jgi:superoxide dismutase, Cu-Zn family